MKKLLLGILLLVSVTSIELPVMARVTSVSAQKKVSHFCSATKNGLSRCDHNVIITADNSPQTDMSGNGTDCTQGQLDGFARCHSVVATDSPAPLAGSLPNGYGPSDFLTAYRLTDAANNSTSTTIAIVDAYDSPTIESDLAVYSQTYGLPACTTANGCFRKVTQRGDQNYPAANSSWALEISLDVEIVHAICPNCKILLVEADNNSYFNLGLAVNQAVSMGAKVVSNSYGGNEFTGETYYDKYYNHPGVAIVASSGDSQYGVEYPAASPYVTAVGGTTLLLNSDGTRSSETVWNGSGSGCSTVEPKPKWQPDRLCKGRAVVDVAANADPSTGAAVYDTTPSPYGQGWLKVGGTSLAAPLIAGVYALAGNASPINGASHIYTNTSVRRLYNVTSGSNDKGDGSCTINYMCYANYGYTQYGYNGPTGFGTPMGPNAF